MKKTPLKRSKKPLRKRSKSKATVDKADRALQDWFRAKYPYDKCEVCGRLAELRHHHILKSQSNAARFNYDNLIAMCKFCHSKLHFGDLNIISIYSAKRGNEWVEKMSRLKKISIQYFTKKELEQVINMHSV